MDGLPVEAGTTGIVVRVISETAFTVEIPRDKGTTLVSVMDHEIDHAPLP